MADEQSLVSRRPRRSTAGNRMELALAELALEEPQEPEEDVDFIVDKEEEDIFESDFASTDEEAAQEGVEEGDQTVRDDERRERKTTRTRVEKATATAHARQRVTFNPESASHPKSQSTQKSKRRVSLGVVVNAETGEVIQGGVGTAGVKRKSQRRHTIMNTSATVNRIKDAEEKRAAIPKKTKTTTRLPTQDELIARALDTEEGNITEHRNYLRLEEEKRAKARVIKQSIEGPVLRWVSKKETIHVEVQLPSFPPPSSTTSANLYAGRYSFVYASGIGPGTVGSQAYSMPFYSYTPLATQSAATKPQGTTMSANASSSYSNGNPPASASTSTSTTPTSLTPQATLLATTAPPSSNIQDHASSSQTQQTQSQLQTQPLTQTQAQTPVQFQPSPMLFSYPAISTPPLVAHRTEDVCKNYIIHELSQTIPSKPPWKSTMSAMFGDHVQWDQVKVFTSKGRPLSRPVRTCPITGLPAKYCDPKTNVPFADVGSYNVLTRVFGREYAWSSALGCYVGGEMGRKDVGSGGEAEGSGNPDAVSKSGEGEESAADGNKVVDTDCGGEELEERGTKRRRVEATEG